MNKILENIVIELDPRHDFDNIRFFNHVKTDSLAEKAIAQLKNSIFFLTLVKPLVRSGVVGGSLGALGNYIAGNSPVEGFEYGAVIGGYLDAKIYMIRGIYYYFKEQKNPSD